jgi:glutaredoxin
MEAPRRPLAPILLLVGVGLMLFMGIVVGAARAVARTMNPISRVSPEARTPGLPAPDGVRVVVYTTSWCSVCKRAKQWLSAQGIPYEERDVEASRENAREMRALNPRGGVPTFDLDGQVLIGFSEQTFAIALRRAEDQRSSHAPL